jgi:hypothetical protein
MYCIERSQLYGLHRGRQGPNLIGHRNDAERGKEFEIHSPVSNVSASLRTGAGGRARKLDGDGVTGSVPIPEGDLGLSCIALGLADDELTSADVSAYRTPPAASATLAALLLQRTHAGVGDRAGQWPAPCEHVAQIRRRGSQTTLSSRRSRTGSIFDVRRGGFTSDSVDGSAEGVKPLRRARLTSDKASAASPAPGSDRDASA